MPASLPASGPQPGWGQNPQGWTPVACYRHPDRPAGVGCQRCGRPICGECMIVAPVGHHCPECVARAMAESRQGSLPFGGHRSANPAATSIALIAANVVVFFAVFLTGGTRGPLFSWLALSPQSICQVSAGYYPGLDAAACVANGGAWLPGVSGGAWWQLITSAFTHNDLMHIAFNMLALWFLGPSLEAALGRARFLALYGLSALAGSVLAVWLSSPLTQTVGASGAIFGLLGGLLVLAVRARADVRTLLFWLGLNVAISVVGIAYISWQGHLGGFLGGAATAALLIALRRDPRRRQWPALILMAALLLGTVFAYTVIA